MVAPRRSERRNMVTPLVNHGHVSDQLVNTDYVNTQKTKSTTDIWFCSTAISAKISFGDIQLYLWDW